MAALIRLRPRSSAALPRWVLRLLRFFAAKTSPLFPDRRDALSYALAKLSRSLRNFCQLASWGREARRRSLAWGRDSAVSRNGFLGSGSGCLGRGRRFLGWVRHFLGHGNGFLDQGNLVLAGEVNFLAKNRSGRAGERTASCPPKAVRVRANASATGWHKS